MEENRFIKEMKEQPRALAETLSFYKDNEKGKALINRAFQFYQEHGIKNIIITGMGSSYFAGLIGAYYLQSKGVRAFIEDTSEMLRYWTRPTGQQFEDTIYIFISQSGESGEIISVLEKWRIDEDNLKEHIWAITNTPESTLGKHASIVFPTIAGDEKSVTSKTYITAILVNYIIARSLTGETIGQGTFSQDANNIINLIESGLNGTWDGCDMYEYGLGISSFLGDLNFINFIGTGTSMATVLQATLNFKEITKLYAEGITLGMFRHGPIETISPNFRAIIIVSDKEGTESARDLVEKIIGVWGGGKVLVMTNYPELFYMENNLDKILIIPNPIQDPYLAPIYDIIILQHYMCIVAEKRGYTPGEFINSRKITK